ncbi:hypothetical protein CRENBAI_007796 [Crenichthys baileyi]|uniref:Uncharacterized protein n=1 Tax=Crenichthys baileyi TaxID=28760 RepID=A0AAV9S5M1_9TELE
MADSKLQTSKQPASERSPPSNVSTESTTKCTHLTLASSILERQSKLVFLQTIHLKISSPTCTTDIHQPPRLCFIFPPSEDFLQLHSLVCFQSWVRYLKFSVKGK